MNFTLVSTVFNEARRLDQTIEDLESQTLQPSEIIITDAGSTDGTYEMLLAWQQRSKLPIIILQKHKCNVAEGRNMAIKAAKYELIASTDFGCRFDHRWLESLMSPFADPAIKVVGGAFAVLEEDILTMPARAAYILSDGYHVDVNASWFIPSSRSIAYYKEVFFKVGGYCEWLTLAADDLVFGMAVKSAGYKFHIAPTPMVFWGRHTSKAGYVKEAFRYGLGDGEARVNYRSTISSFLEMIFRVVFFLSLLFCAVLVISGYAHAGILLVPLLFIPGLRSYIRYFRSWLKFKSDKYNFKVFVYGLGLLEQTRVSYFKGYIKGYMDKSEKKKQGAKVLKQQLTP